MSKILSFQLTRSPSDGQDHLVIYDDDFKPYLVTSQHPRWESILELVFDDDPEALDLIDIGGAVVRSILSDRVSYTYNKLFFDGDEIAGELSDHILRAIKENGVGASTPLVNFLEKVNQNPSENSRKQLYSFLQKHDFTITPDGDSLGYKGVYRTEDAYESVSAGPAIVNGVVHEEGRVPQGIGDIIEMERSRVADNPSVACSRGLHVANWRYASTFGGKATLVVKVNPRDVVSVPTDSNNEKIRCCRYYVLEETTTPYTSAILNGGSRENPVPEYWEWVTVRDDWNQYASDQYDNFIEYVNDNYPEYVQVGAFSDQFAAMNRENWREASV